MNIPESNQVLTGSYIFLKNVYIKSCSWEIDSPMLRQCIQTVHVSFTCFVSVQWPTWCRFNRWNMNAASQWRSHREPARKYIHSPSYDPKYCHYLGDAGGSSALFIEVVNTAYKVNGRFSSSENTERWYQLWPRRKGSPIWTEKEYMKRSWLTFI